MVDDLIGLFSAIQARRKSGAPGSRRYSLESFLESIFCPKCGSVRKCNLEPVLNKEYFFNNDTKKIDPESLPIVYRATCFQCNSVTLLIIYQGPESLELAILHDTYGGCVTPNTPDEIKYYIDQAYRARSMGALSAAMAMYRSALEWMLYHQGYREGMLGSKIAQLEKAIENGSAPKWAIDIGVDFLAAIKDIGNGAIHTNGGEIEKQKDIDKHLIEIVDIVFAEVLDKAYEQPIRSASRLSALQSVSAKLTQDSK